ncbi:MAG: hypothetical protein ACRC75_10785 [Olsenella sp.]
MDEQNDTHSNVRPDGQREQPAEDCSVPSSDLPLKHFALLYCLAIAAIAVIIVLVTTLPVPGKKAEEESPSAERTTVVEEREPSSAD